MLSAYIGSAKLVPVPLREADDERRLGMVATLGTEAGAGPQCMGNLTGRRCTVTFPYDPRRTLRVGEVLCDVLHEPAHPLSGTGLPYHPDSHHARVLSNVREGARVVAIGCEGGQMRRWVTSFGLRYYGTDISLTRVDETLRSYGGPTLWRCPFPGTQGRCG